MAVFHISYLSFLLSGKLDTSCKRRGLLYEGLSNQSVDGWCVLFGSPLDDRASHDTILQFSSVVPEVNIFFHSGILGDGLCCPHKKCRGYSLYVRLPFVGAIKDHRLICQNNKICLPKALQKKTVDWYHDMLCHPGET